MTAHFTSMPDDTVRPQGKTCALTKIIIQLNQINASLARTQINIGPQLKWPKK